MNIAALKNKPIAKGPKEVKVLFGREPVNMPEEPHPAFIPEGGGGPSAVRRTSQPQFIIDKTKETTLDRDFIMARLRKLVKPVIEEQEKVVIEEQEKVAVEEPNIEKPQKIVIDEPEKEIVKQGEFATIQEVKESAVLPEPPKVVKKVVKVAKAPKPVYEPARILFEGNINEVMIGNETIEKRLPPSRKEVIRASSYYMNNRRLFQQKLADLFKPHKADLMKPDDDVSCDFRKEGSKFELLTHQQIVTDYLNLYSPYRGLLIYHGLGSGKTCTSIAIAEGMKSDRPVFILTPASLSMNYTSELKKCGDPLYKKNQFWEFVDTKKEPNHVAPLAIIMSLTQEFIRSHGGVWMVNVKKESNFDSLSKEQQEEIEDQIDEMIKAKYRGINYNANNFMSKLEHYGGGGNPFDNSVVIVDEGHNLVSRIVNKLKRPQSHSVRLYKYLMSAVNAKIVFLSGTPIINYPNEIAIMFNMLRGYIKTWTFNVKVNTSEKITRDEILKWFNRDKFNLYDYVEYSSNKLIVTRNPYGFVNVKKRKTATLAGEDEPDEFDKYGGVTLGEDGKMSDADFENAIKRILKKNNVDVSDSNIKIENHTALPDDTDAFLNMFIDPDTGVMKNVDLFQRRILGLTSYFKSAQEKLLPKYNKAKDFTIVPCMMEDYQFGVYSEARVRERDKDAKNRRSKHTKKTDELYNKMSSTYRVFSRAFCNFAFPDPPGRPMPPAKITQQQSNKGPASEKLYKMLNVSKDADEKEVKEAYQKMVLQYPEKSKELQDAYDQIIASLHIEDEDQSEDAIDASEVNDETGEETKDKSYESKVVAALKYLKDHETEYLVKDRLHMYSTKMCNLLDNIMDEDNAGLHLVYSQFRTIEGIGIIKLILEANGFAEFKLVKQSGDWTIKPDAEGDEGKPKFVLYTGTETTEEKEIVRNIYNSNWKNVPAQIKVELEKIAKNNYMGEIIKIFMITASGAEGINLENTRFVHVVEPYWHPVRMEQVIGRARRICSHSNLPEELRNVRVFLYLSVLSDTQRTDKKNIELRTKDISRINQRPVTTDEYLFELSTMKDEITKQILKAVKETAMDCSLHKLKKGGGDDEQYVCYNFGKVTSNEFSSLPILEMDATQQTALNVNKKVIKGRALKINGIKYIQKQGTQELYNAETMELVAMLVETADGKVKIELL
jgi:hypothetical protein